MKAIFSNFSRRANVDRSECSDSPRRLKPSLSAAATREGPRFQATFSSLDAAAGGIGDAPVKPSDRSSPDHFPSRSSVWASKLPGSFIGTAGRRKGSEAEANAGDLVQAGVAAPDNAAPASRPSHPPSSYREPPQQASGPQVTARGLVRKFSSTSRRASSASRELASDADAHVGAAPRLKQLPSAPDLGSVRSGPPRSSGTLDVAQPLAPPNSTPPGRSPAQRVDLSIMTSAELAARLNELAVANADGLLTDDEYRTLRQAVFDRMLHADKQSMAAPTAGGLSGYGLPAHVHSRKGAVESSELGPSSSTNLASVNAGRSGSSLGHGDQQATSIRSGRSGKASSYSKVADLFTRGGTSSKAMHPQPSQDSHSSHEFAQRDAAQRAGPIRRDSEGMSSQISSSDGHSQRALSFITHQSSAARSSRVSTLGRLRAGSQSRRERAEVASRDMEEAYSAERTARSLRAVSLYDAGSVDLANLSSSSNVDKSSTSLRAEIAPSTMFGAEYVDKSSSEIRAEMAVVQAEGNRLLSTFTALEETLVAKHPTLEPRVIHQAIEGARESTPLACVVRLEDEGRDAANIRAQRPPPPSSYRTPRQLSASTSLLSENGSVRQVRPFVSSDAAAFEVELTRIYAQKAAVVKRYQDRLAFLQSKLRSAAIREGLK